ncbi:hypothetical protein V5O48_012495 [Marasmius crinis-equi]|uniref:Uncharacterized protein n=1 Tax=Marasmius crinis-equi TaxID=585013 RepID=A0ABR3F2Q0_9AGAR
MTKIVIAVNGMSAGIDVLIALSMVFLLTVRKTRVNKTNRLLRQIVSPQRQFPKKASGSQGKYVPRQSIPSRQAQLPGGKLCARRLGQ